MYMSEGLEAEQEKSYTLLQSETIRRNEYENALANLRRFASMRKEDIEQIRTLDDLSLRIRNVGRDLRIVILSSDKVYDFSPPSDRYRYKKTMEAPIAGGEIDVIV